MSSWRTIGISLLLLAGLADAQMTIKCGDQPNFVCAPGSASVNDLAIWTTNTAPFTLGSYAGSGACSNQFMTALSSAGAKTCTTATLASAQFANQGTTTQVLHGNAAGNPSWGSVVDGDLSGQVGVAHGGTGANLSATGGAGQYLKQSTVGGNVTVGTIPASDIASGQAVSKVDDTNVTMTLGGTPTTAALAAFSMTMGWSGTLASTRGGTGQNNSGTTKGAELRADGSAHFVQRAITADVLSYGAVCDGSTDDTTAIQAAIDAMTTNGGTVLIPGGLRCAIASSLTMKSNVVIRCEGNGGFKAIAGATAILATASAISDWEIRDCTFDMNSIVTATVGVKAVAFTAGASSGARARFNHNTVKNTPTTGATAYNLVEIGCSSGFTLGTEGCEISENTITGSATAGNKDTCLAIYGGDILFLGQTIVRDNQINHCGVDGIAVTGNGGVFSANSINQPLRYGLTFQGGPAIVSGNKIASTGDAVRMTNSAADISIESNEITLGQIHSIASAGASIGGIKVGPNYAARGVWLEAQGTCTGGAGSCTNANSVGSDQGAGCACHLNTACNSGTCANLGLFNHCEVTHNVFSQPSLDTVLVENGSNILIDGNTDVSSLTGNKASIHIRQTTNSTGAADLTAITIANNVVAMVKGANTSQAILIDRPQGSNAINDLTMIGNYSGSQTVGVQINNSLTGSGWYMSGNNLGKSTTSLQGWSRDYGTIEPTTDIGLQAADIAGYGQGLSARRWAVVQVRDQIGATPTIDATGIDTAVLKTSGGGTNTCNIGTGTNVTDASGDWVNCASAAVNPSTAQWISSRSTITQVRHYPRFSATIETDSVLTNTRYWVGWFRADPGNASATPTAHAAAFRYDSATDTGTTNWRSCTSDGSGGAGANWTCKDTGIAIAASTRYVLTVQCYNTPAESCVFFINGEAATTHSGSDKLPGTSTSLGWDVQNTALSAAAKNIKISRVSWEHD